MPETLATDGHTSPDARFGNTAQQLDAQDVWPHPEACRQRIMEHVRTDESEVELLRRTRPKDAERLLSHPAGAGGAAPAGAGVTDMKPDTPDTPPHTYTAPLQTNRPSGVGSEEPAGAGAENGSPPAGAGAEAEGAPAGASVRDDGRPPGAGTDPEEQRNDHKRVRIEENLAASEPAGTGSQQDPARTSKTRAPEPLPATNKKGRAQEPARSSASGNSRVQQETDASSSSTKKAAETEVDSTQSDRHIYERGREMFDQLAEMAQKAGETVSKGDYYLEDEARWDEWGLKDNIRIYQNKDLIGNMVTNEEELPSFGDHVVHELYGYEDGFVDEITGLPLPKEDVLAARADEINDYLKYDVFKEVDVDEAWATTGKAPVSSRWKDINKGDRDHMQVRSRLIAQEIKKKGWESVFTACPPWTVFQLMLSSVMTKPTGAGSSNAKRNSYCWTSREHSSTRRVGETYTLHHHISSEQAKPGSCRKRCTVHSRHRATFSTHSTKS